jgi:hypothetical protein
MPVVVVTEPNAASREFICAIQEELRCSFTKSNWNEDAPPDLTLLTTLTTVPAITPAFASNFFFLFCGLSEDA